LEEIRLNSDREHLHQTLGCIDELKEYFKENRIELDHMIIEMVKIGALCHDIGHGPFSHIFDDHFIRNSHPNDHPNATHEDRSSLIIRLIVEDIKIYEDRAKLFFQHNISKILMPWNIKDFNTFGQKLIERKIISDVDGDLISRINTFLASNIGDDIDKNSQTILCMTDTLLSNITTDIPFEISYKSKPMTELLNMPYKLSYDAFYDSV